jgi:peptide deformylase
VLHEWCDAFYFNQPQTDPSELASDLALIKSYKKGYGLAAPQIGVSLRVFAFLDEVAFNPWVLDASDEEVLAVEGCLSFPGLWIQIKRPKIVKARYLTENGKEVIRELNELESRVYQHELDHLNGKTFNMMASDLKLRRAVESAKKHGYNYNYKELRNQ